MQFRPCGLLVESLASKDGPQLVDCPVSILDFGIHLKEQVHALFLLLGPLIGTLSERVLGSSQEFDYGITIAKHRRSELLILLFGFGTSDLAWIVLGMRLPVPFHMGCIALLPLFELACLTSDVDLGFSLGLKSQLFHGIVAALQHVEAVKHDNLVFLIAKNDGLSALVTLMSTISLRPVT